MPNTLRLLPASCIDDCGSWLFPLCEPDLRLADSLASHGQLTPLLVTENRNRFSLVDGVRRLRLLQQLGREVLTRVVDAPQETEKGLIRLATNQVAETARQSPQYLLPMLRFFQARMEASALDRELPPLLGLEARSRPWKLLRQWCDAMAPLEREKDAEWEEHLHKGRLPLSCVQPLLRFDARQREMLAPFFRELSWSTGGGRELLTLLFESAQGQGKSLEELLAAAELKEFLQAGLSPKDAMTRILERARTLRFPQKTALDARFATIARELCAKTAWTLQPEQNYESDAVYLSTRIRNQKDVVTAAAQLQEMADSARWQELATIAQNND